MIYWFSKERQDQRPTRGLPYYGISSGGKIHVQNIPNELFNNIQVNPNVIVLEKQKHPKKSSLSNCITFTFSPFIYLFISFTLDEKNANEENKIWCYKSLPEYHGNLQVTKTLAHKLKANRKLYKMSQAWWEKRSFPTY